MIHNAQKLSFVSPLLKRGSLLHGYSPINKMVACPARFLSWNMEPQQLTGVRLNASGSLQYIASNEYVSKT